MPHLNLSDLNDGLPAIPPAFGETLAQVGGLCLESRGHERGVQLRVRGDCNNSYSVEFGTPLAEVREK